LLRVVLQFPRLVVNDDGGLRLFVEDQKVDPHSTVGRFIEPAARFEPLVYGEFLLEMELAREGFKDSGPILISGHTFRQRLLVPDPLLQRLMHPIAPQGLLRLLVNDGTEEATRGVPMRASEEVVDRRVGP